MPSEHYQIELEDELAGMRLENARLRNALDRYRYARMPGTSDMRRRLEWAHASDEGRFLTSDRIAEIGKTYLGGAGCNNS
jgi:hypothetical protein